MKTSEDSTSSWIEKHPDLVNDLTIFHAEFVSESDRAAVMLGAAQIDTYLYEILKAVLQPSTGNGDNLLDHDQDPSVSSG